MTPVWRYSLGKKAECVWAIFLIDGAGCFAVLSDFGNWSYRWNKHGMHYPDNFRLDILQMHPEYVIRKLCGESKEYSSEETIQSVKEFILQSRRSGASKEDCRIAWNNLDIYDLDTLESWRDWGSSTNLDEWYETCVRVYPLHLVQLVESYLPALKEAICAENEAEIAQIAEKSKETAECTKSS